MIPPEVNAHYNAVQNEIVFPAGICNLLFSSEGFDAAVNYNYGAIGCVIAHEFTYAFDDQGIQYDADGNLNNWWTEEDLKKFKEKQELITAQYNAYTILDTLHLNGALTILFIVIIFTSHIDNGFFMNWLGNQKGRFKCFIRSRPHIERLHLILKVS